MPPGRLEKGWEGCRRGLMTKRHIQDVIIGFLPSVSRGIDKRASLLIPNIESYFQAVELENGQAEQIREEIENLLKNSAAAGGIYRIEEEIAPDEGCIAVYVTFIRVRKVGRADGRDESSNTF